MNTTTEKDQTTTEKLPLGMIDDVIAVGRAFKEVFRGTSMADAMVPVQPPYVGKKDGIHPAHLRCMDPSHVCLLAADVPWLPAVPGAPPMRIHAFRCTALANAGDWLRMERKDALAQTPKGKRGDLAMYTNIHSRWIGTDNGPAMRFAVAPRGDPCTYISLDESEFNSKEDENDIPKGEVKHRIPLPRINYNEQKAWAHISVSPAALANAYAQVKKLPDYDGYTTMSVARAGNDDEAHLRITPICNGKYFDHGAKDVPFMDGSYKWPADDNTIGAATYSTTEYLERMVRIMAQGAKATKGDDKIALDFAVSRPLQIRWVSGYDTVLDYYLAPRVEN